VHLWQVFVHCLSVVFDQKANSAFGKNTETIGKIHASASLAAVFFIEFVGNGGKLGHKKAKVKIKK